MAGGGSAVSAADCAAFSVYGTSKGRVMSPGPFHADSRFACKSLRARQFFSFRWRTAGFFKRHQVFYVFGAKGLSAYAL